MNQLKKQIAQLKNQRHHMSDKITVRTIDAALRALTKQVEKLQLVLKTSIDNDSALSKEAELLSSICGIGTVSVYQLLAFLPDLEHFKTAKQLAAFIGITPRQNQSGQKTGKTRISKIGHASLRRALYMPALTAKKSNLGLKAFAARLEKNGLSKKAIVIAVMRKLAHIIFAVLKKEQPYDPALTCAR